MATAVIPSLNFHPRLWPKNHYCLPSWNFIAAFLEHIEFGFHGTEHRGRSLLVFAIGSVRTRSIQPDDEDPTVFQVHRVAVQRRLYLTERDVIHRLAEQDYIELSGGYVGEEIAAFKTILPAPAWTRVCILNVRGSNQRRHHLRRG